jgi:hypothetical protein
MGSRSPYVYGCFQLIKQAPMLVDNVMIQVRAWFCHVSARGQRPNFPETPVAKVTMTKITIEGPIRKAFLYETWKQVKECGVKLSIDVTILCTSCATSWKCHRALFDVTDSSFRFRIWRRKWITSAVAIFICEKWHKISF